jgi:hypothetical protein
MVAQTRTLTAASRTATAAAVGSADGGAYLGRVRRLFGVDTTAPFTALYIWWPDTLQRTASPSGRHLLLRVRPAPGETVNSADVVAHEAIHVLASLMPETAQRDVCGALPSSRNPSQPHLATSSSGGDSCRSALPGGAGGTAMTGSTCLRGCCFRC